VIVPTRLKGGKPKPDAPPERPDHYSPACHCPKCTLYDGRRQVRKRTPPAVRYLPILPEMKPLLKTWLNAIKARVGADYGPNTPLWLSRKRGKGGVWQAISRQMYWQLIVDACKRVELPEFNWRNFGMHSGRKTVVTTIVEETGDITAAQHFIGHASSAMTDKYNRADPRKQRAIGLVAARRNWTRSAAA
jgi:integrase